MKVIFDSIIVDPLMFYAVIAGTILLMLIILVLLLKKRSKKPEYVKLEPIIIQKYNNEDNKEKPSGVVDVPLKEEENIENIIDKMEETLKQEVKAPPKEYEQIEEEQSIISYQELIKLKLAEPVKKEVIEEKPVISAKTEEAINKFKNSEFISPVYGKVSNEPEYPKIKQFKNEDIIDTLDLEMTKTADTKPLKEEPNKSEEFLNSLKDFRKNLE